MTRALLVAACVVFFVLALAGMHAGWTHRARGQAALAPLPTAGPDLGPALCGPTRGLYVGTTSAGRWQDRVVARGLGVRADATMTLRRGGLVIERTGAADLFIPAGAVVAAGVGAGLAGKVMGPGGLLLVRWRLGDTELDTGLRADDKTTYPAWVAAIDQLVGGEHVMPAEGERA